MQKIKNYLGLSKSISIDQKATHKLLNMSPEISSTQNFDSTSRDIKQYNTYTSATSSTSQDKVSVIQSILTHVNTLRNNQQHDEYKDIAKQSIQCVREYVRDVTHDEISISDSNQCLQKVLNKMQSIIDKEDIQNHNVSNCFMILCHNIGPIEGSTQYCNYQDNRVYLEIIGHVIMDYAL